MKDKDFVWDNFQKGVSDSPHFGMGDVRNVDLVSNPGIATINPSLVKASSTNVTDLIKWIVINPNSGIRYGLGTSGKLYSDTGSWTAIAGHSSSNANGNGLAYWKDYLLIARESALDVYGPLSGAAAWTHDFQVLTSDNQFHPMLHTQDDKLHIGAGRYVSVLREELGFTFNPSSSFTFGFTAQGLSLPSNYRIKCLEELADQLMIGTWQGTQVNDMRVADIFPWDKKSPSFGQPIKLNTNGVHQIKNINNVLFIVAGLHGEVYLSNGSTTKFLRRIPPHLSGADATPDNYYDFFPGACMVIKDRFYFAPSKNQLSSAIGVWSIGLGGDLTFENKISTGTMTSANTLQIGALGIAGSYNYLVSWNDNGTYGVDATDSTARHSSYGAYLRSRMERIATALAPKTYTQLEIQLAEPLAANQGVRVGYRTGTTGNFTTLLTFDYTTYPGAQSVNEPVPLPSTENIQLEAALTTSGSTTPKLREIRLR